MSLLSSIQLAGNSLQAQQIGLQVVGQNISNANTPGYIREQVELTPATTEREGNLLLGAGVQVQGVEQVTDQFLDNRVRSASSDQSGSSTTAQTYQQLESLFGALNNASNGGTNLDSAMTSFFSSISQVLNSPQDSSVRQLAVSSGQALAGDFNDLANRTNQLRSDLNNQVIGDAGSINNLLTQIRSLNLQITQTQGGTNSSGQAVGLLDQRDQALNSLSQLMNITTQQQTDGTVTVYSGGQYLVDEGQLREVKVDQTEDRGTFVANLHLADTDAPLSITSGEVGGLINSRDQVLGGFLDQLNSLAGTLSGEFNKLYSSGQGLNGYSQVTSTNSPSSAFVPLDAAGLAVTPTNGSFQVQVYDQSTGLTQTTNIAVHETGLGDDTTLSSLAGQLNGVAGLSASITPTGQLTISTTSPDQQVAFSNDTSGALAALGINTFFSGSDAASLSVTNAVVQDPSTFAASAGGVGVDTQVAQQLAGFADQPLDSLGGSTITDQYNQVAANVTEGSNQAQASSAAATTFQQSLLGQQQAISGVSLDDETVNMLQYQRSYQASAKYISTLNDLLNTLVQL